MTFMIIPLVFRATEGIVTVIKNALQIGVLNNNDHPSTASGPPPFDKGGK